LTAVLDKECLCIGLSNSAAINYNNNFVKKLNAVTICPGPNIVNFSTIVSLQTMVDHIYGRKDILSNKDRPHMFIAELNLYIDYLKEMLTEAAQTDQFDKNRKKYISFYQNIRDGIAYYSSLSCVSVAAREAFNKSLELAGAELDCLNYQYDFN
jgi:hypothetical protein